MAAKTEVQKLVARMEKRPEKVSDDEFTWWYDAQDWEGMSPYEIASAAWEEAVRRMLQK